MSKTDRALDIVGGLIDLSRYAVELIRSGRMEDVDEILDLPLKISLSKARAAREADEKFGASS